MKERRLEDLEYTYGLKKDEADLSPREMEERLDRLCKYLREKHKVEPEKESPELDRSERIKRKLEFVENILK